METITELNDDVPDSAKSNVLAQNRLYFRPDIDTLEALEMIKSHGFKCGFNYKLTIYNKKGEAQEITRAVFSNKYKDILSIWCGDEKFYAENVPKNRLSAIRLVYENGEYKQKGYLVTPQDEYLHSKRDIPEIDRFNLETPRVKALEEIDVNCFEGKKFPLLENPKVQEQTFVMQKEGINCEALWHITRLCNLHEFPKTYEMFSPEFKEIYKLLLDSCEDKFYHQLASIFDTTNGEYIINRVLEILNIKLEKTKLLEALESHKGYNDENQISLKCVLLKLKKTLLSSEEETIFDRVSKYPNWFSEEQTQIVSAKVFMKTDNNIKSRIGVLQ